eukprot:COSAG01_NODE_31404_length_598_cov_1.162325_1_plen_69_part_10
MYTSPSKNKYYGSSVTASQQHAKCWIKSEEQSAECGQEWTPECRHECRVKSDRKSAFILPRSDSRKFPS